MAFARKEDQEKAKDNLPTKKGMEYNRSCTDCLCCLAFIIFVVVMIGISGYAISTGNPELIFTPFDSDGNQCGKPDQRGYNDTTAERRDFTDYPYKQFTGLDKILNADLNAGTTDSAMYDAICVKECLSFQDMPLTGVTFESMSTSTQPANLEWSILDDPILVGTANTTLQYGICVPAGMTDPENFEKIYDAIMEEINGGFGSYITDFKDSWQVLLIMGFATMFITLIYIYLLRCLTKPILYGSLLLIFVALVLCTYYTYENTLQFEDKESNDYKFAMFLFVLFAILTVCYMILVCCMWSAISLGASVMETASDFIGENKKVVFLPFFAYLMCLPILVWWTVTSIFIYGLGTPEFNPEGSFVCKIAASQQSEYMFWYNLFGLFWLVAFIIAVQLFVTGCTVCLWYFGGHGSDEGEGDKPAGVWISVKWAFRYHLGSLAWGSFLIAVITMIRVIFEYIVYQYEKTSMKDNIVFKIVTCIVRCYLKCLDCCVKFMNKNAYIQVALHSESFCTGAKNSFWIMAQNGRRFTAVGVTGAILLFIGKALITVSCTFLTVAIIDAQFPEIEQPMVPALVVAIFAYMIASVFLSVFDFSALTILHCFCLDESQGGGTRNTPDGLKKFLEKDDEMDKMKKANAIV